MYLVKWFMFFD